MAAPIKKPRQSRKCVECTALPTKLDKARDVYLCDQCADSPKYKLIYHSHAKKEYRLNDNDLMPLLAKSFEKKTAYCMATLYLLTDVEEVCRTKYGCAPTDNTLQILAKIEKIKSDKVKKRVANRNKKETGRKTRLVARLNDHGLELRYDSKLCTGYIDGTITDWTVDQICHRMCQMKYLFDYCNMDHYLEKAHEANQDEYNAGYIPDSSPFDDAEWMALKKHGVNGKYPKDWPWLQQG